MTVQILGGGCSKCEQLAANAREALDVLDLTAEIEKITDIDVVLDMGCMITPGLAVDGAVRSSGKVLSPLEIREILLAGR